jgi:hypothetical protein
MILFIILLILASYAVYTTREDPNLTALKHIYYKFIQRLPEKYDMIKTPINITGTYGGDIGSNVNKGSEIYICLDGTVNDSFHVLLHELAHSTVDEYDHSSKFWENFTELREIAIRDGLYESIGQRDYCGKKISDS